MLTIFKHFKGKLHVSTKVIVDGHVSNLHKFTSILLFGACILVCSKQYIGEPIRCIQDINGDDATIEEKVMNTFCFVMTTYTVTPDHLGQGSDAIQQAHPGVQPDIQGAGPVRRHAYYQWVPIVLFLQAAIFNIPHWLWVRWEGGLVRRLISGAAVLENKVYRGDKEGVTLIAKYFVGVLGRHDFLVFGWIFCDVLALVNVLGNIALTDRLLGGHFLQYGIQVMDFLRQPSPSNTQNPLHQVFPKVTKCTFHKFGPSGSLQHHDALCIMALNVINEKIYVFLWFWLLLLGVFTMFCILGKIGCVAVLSWVPHSSLESVSSSKWTQQLVGGAPLPLQRSHLQPLLHRFSACDWIFFHLIIVNMMPAAYTHFVLTVGRLLKEKQYLLRPNDVTK